MSEKQAKRRLAFQKSYSIEKSEPIRRRSLIDDAKFDKLTNLGLQLLAEQNRARISSETSIGEDDELEYSDEEEAGLPVWACIIQPKNGHSVQLSSLLHVFEKHSVEINHIESRPITDCNTLYNRPIEVLVQFNLLNDKIQSIQNDIQNNIELSKTLVTKFQCLTPRPREDIWIPIHITDLDKCNHLITKFEPDLDQGHPGFDDLSYRKRRQTIANIAFNYKQNDQIPNVEYVAEEIKAWKDTYLKLREMTKTMGSQIYLDNLKLLEDEGVYSCEFIPQLNTVSTFLKRRSGFTLRPAAGLLSARDFLASLAFRVFQCTQYVRHYSRPDHSPEPDCIHELMGHMPMFADPDFAQFSQEIGILSLGACDEDIEKLATLYWFTVEFGLCKEDGQIKAYGAGLLSSYGELEHALSGKPELKPFEPATASIQPYQDDDFQPVYFVTESFDDMKEKVRMFAQSIVKQYELRYDPYTSSVQILDNNKTIHEVIEVVKDELNHLYTVLHKLRKNKKRSSIERKTAPKLSNGVS